MTFLTEAAGRVISSDMVAVFHATDDALLSSARVAASMLEGTAKSDLHPRAKQKLLESLSAGFDKMLAGRRDMVNAHGQMIVIQRQSNLAPVGFGCWGAPSKVLTGQDHSAPIAELTSSTVA